MYRLHVAGSYIDKFATCPVLMDHHEFTLAVDFTIGRLSEGSIDGCTKAVLQKHSV